jgi:hypothetical protein
MYATDVNAQDTIMNAIESSYSITHRCTDCDHEVYRYETGFFIHCRANAVPDCLLQTGSANLEDIFPFRWQLGPCPKCPDGTALALLEVGHDQQLIIVYIDHLLPDGSYSPIQVSLIPHVRLGNSDDSVSYFTLDGVVQYKGNGTLQDGHYRSLVRIEDQTWWVVDGDVVERAESQTEPWAADDRWINVMLWYRRVEENVFYEMLGRISIAGNVVDDGVSPPLNDQYDIVMN